MFTHRLVSRWFSAAAFAVLLLTTLVTNIPSVSAATSYTNLGPEEQSEPTFGAQATAGRFFFVSKRGNNRDGRSWATAWNELDRINWAVVQPGDSIVIDGGATSMLYTTTLTIRKNGAPGRPIVIRPSMHPGYNGKVVIFGGRSTGLPYCGQSGYAYQTAGVRPVGIRADNAAWVTIDGLRWRNIAITGHNGAGVQFSSGSNNITLRNLDIFDNGSATQEGGKWYPVRYGQSEGISLSGTNITVDRTVVRDNGSDAIQSGGGVRNFKLTRSWLANGRKAPNGEVFNRCTHQDGIQVHNGGTQSGVTIEDSIVGPGFLQGVWLAGTSLIHDVTIRHTLLYGSDNLNIGNKGNPTQRWVLDNVTSVRKVGQANHNINVGGTGHTIRNSIFVGGNNLTLAASPSASGNCQYQVPRGRTIGTAVDPRFVNPGAGNFALQAGSPCAGKGSRVTSVQQLLSR